MLTLHTPNNTPHERPVFIEIEETGGTMQRLMGQPQMQPAQGHREG